MSVAVIIALPEQRAAPHVQSAPGRSIAWLLLLWLAIYVFTLFSPPLLDDADATHAQAAQAMVHNGDWVTLHVDGIRYLEKPPLPYWLAAASLRVFGANTFAIHLPLALTVLGLCLLAYRWGERAFDERTGLYAGAFTLTAAGVFLFTRFFIPDALLALLLALALYTTLRALDRACHHPRRYAWATSIALAGAVLTKGLVAMALYLGSLLLFLSISRQWGAWRRLHPLSSCVVFLLLAAPWHLLAGLRNGGGTGGHGFFWFYFVNEHVLRFLGRRVPRDYNKLPAALYWTLHLVWLFPWSLFLPAGLLLAWNERTKWLSRSAHEGFSFRRGTVLLLTLFTALVLVFFSLSTNQEYYTLPIYLPVLLLLAASLVRAEGRDAGPALGHALTAAHATLTVLGFCISTALLYGLWCSRHLPYVADIGSLLAHRGVGDYTLSMSHFFDLTTSSFAALRLPAWLALLAFALGPAAAWRLRARGRQLASTISLVLTSTMFLMAAHVALGRFAPLLSSFNFAQRIAAIERDQPLQANEVLLYGDQAYGSSIPFYLGRQVELVDGRSTSMLFGSSFPDAPPIFLSPDDLLARWGKGRRKLLFVPAEKRPDVDRLLGSRQFVLMESSGKELITDRVY